MTCERVDSMAALALGALAPQEGEAARRHVVNCEECQTALARYEATVGTLESALPRQAPPPLDAARLRPERRRARSRGLLVAAVAAAVAAVLAVAALRGDTGPQPVATLKPGNAGAQTHGEGRITHAGRSGSYLVVNLQDVPRPPAGRHYEVWVLRRGAVEMSPLGAFRSAGTVTLRLPLPGEGPYSAVDVSIQRDGGPHANSGVHLASGAFRQS